MKQNNYINGSFQSAAKLGICVLIAVLQPLCNGEEEPARPVTFKAGDIVKLNRPAVLYFKDQLFKTGAEGDSFLVLAYRPEQKKVFVAGKDKNGKDIALSVTEECVIQNSKSTDAPVKSVVEPVETGDTTSGATSALKVQPARSSPAPATAPNQASGNTPGPAKAVLTSANAVNKYQTPDQVRAWLMTLKLTYKA